MNGIIGLEIHTYLITKEKLFCHCAASREKGLQANVNICPICTGQPGAKPLAPNEEAVKKAVQIGLLLGCKISERMKWQRKHYSWPDLPKGYQTTLSGPGTEPLGTDGEFEGIKISSMHLEEDPASWDPKSGCVDYNRSGLPLVEIVTSPDFSFSDEVVSWLQKLIHALSYLKAVDRDAGVKMDVNINMIRNGKKTERVEVKNINSLESVKKAIDYELDRQSKEGSVRETRRFDDEKGKTVSMRVKEKQDDYRFISDPDLPDLVLNRKFVNSLKDNLPELPSVKLEKLIKKYKIPEQHASVLARDVDIVGFFEKVAEEIDGSFALHWVTGELQRVLNWNKKFLHEVSIDVNHFVSLIKMVKDGKITELQAKKILNSFIPKSFDPSKTEGKIDDPKELKKIIEKIIKENKKVVEDYKKGDKNAFNFLMGEVMKTTNRRADYKVAREVLEKELR